MMRNNASVRSSLPDVGEGDFDRTLEVRYRQLELVSDLTRTDVDTLMVLGGDIYRDLHGTLDAIRGATAMDIPGQLQEVLGRNHRHGLLAHRGRCLLEIQLPADRDTEHIVILRLTHGHERLKDLVRILAHLLRDLQTAGHGVPVTMDVILYPEFVEMPHRIGLYVHHPDQRFHPIKKSADTMKYATLGFHSMAEFIVYESMSSIARDLEDAGRFENTVRKLSAVGIMMECRAVKDGSEIDGEASELYRDAGDGCLPMATYMGVVVCSGRYPTDQEIVDYIDVPPGTLDAKRTTLAQANDLPPACGCRRRS